MAEERTEAVDQIRGILQSIPPAEALRALITAGSLHIHQIAKDEPGSAEFVAVDTAGLLLALVRDIAKANPNVSAGKPLGILEVVESPELKLLSLDVAQIITEKFAQNRTDMLLALAASASVAASMITTVAKFSDEKSTARVVIDFVDLLFADLTSMAGEGEVISPRPLSGRIRISLREEELPHTLQ